MVPRDPPKRPQLGFLYIPPYRVQGISIAGEMTFVQVPELDVCFDIGAAPRLSLASNFVALTHGHMDHAAGLAYYFSQRHFQGMGTGTVLCHPDLEQPIHNIMKAWVGVERQRTPYNIIPLGPGDEHEIKNNIVLRAFETDHTVSSVGYVAIEKRSKLRPEFVGLPQEKLMAIKAKGEEITRILEIPLVAYTGDTAWGTWTEMPEVMNAQILISECTFTEKQDKNRAAVGKHMHVDHILDLLKVCKSEAIILTHLSRRTHIGEARKVLDKVIPASEQERVFMLMDTRFNKRRYEQQLHEAEAAEITT